MASRDGVFPSNFLYKSQSASFWHCDLRVRLVLAGLGLRLILEFCLDEAFESRLRVKFCDNNEVLFTILIESLRLLLFKRPGTGGTT